MVRTIDCQTWCDAELKRHGLTSWKTIFTKSGKWIARCYYDERRIVFNILHLASRSEVEVKQTILHEVAHALVGPGFGHNEVWRNKAKELGLENPLPCAPSDVDAGRSINEAETPKRTFNRLNILCPVCKVQAEETSSAVINGKRWSRLKCGHLIKKEVLSDSFNFSDWTSKTGKKLYPFQIEGIKFLESSGGRALIADEPGLGKTLQALGFLYANKEQVSPTLWVCKTTLKLQTVKEALDWCGPEFMAQIIYNPRNIIIPGLRLYIISMDLLRNMKSETLDSINFKTIIADEIQHFKNPDSTRTAELRKLVSRSSYFIALSGTPWKNRGQEYFPVLNMIDSSKFPSYASFKNRWVDYYTDPKTFKVKQGGIRNIPAFKEYTKDFIVRRLRDEVLPDLPKINRQIRFIDMEGLYQSSYDKAEAKVAAVIRSAMIDGKDAQSIASEIMLLKHITGLAKVQPCIEDIQEFLEQTEDFEKITIFHHHIDVGDNLQQGDKTTYKGLDEWLVNNGYNKSLRLYGGRSPEERNDVINKFRDDIRNRVLIASTLASGEGLNIQFCQNAVMLERQWNPANEEQAELRFSRPLTKGELPDYLHHIVDRQVSIRIPYYIADQTVDSMLTDIVERKRIAFRNSMDDAGMTWDTNEMMKELGELIVKKVYGGKR